MYAKSTRPSAKREVQKDRSAKRDDQIARPRRAQACERSELRAKRVMRMCPRSGQIFKKYYYEYSKHNRPISVIFYLFPKISRRYFILRGKFNYRTAIVDKFQFYNLK